MSKCHTHYTGMAVDNPCISLMPSLTFYGSFMITFFTFLKLNSYSHAFSEVWTLSDLYKNIFVMKLGDTHPLIHKKLILFAYVSVIISQFFQITPGGCTL